MVVTTHPTVNGATFMLSVTGGVTIGFEGPMTLFSLRVDGIRLIGHLVSGIYRVPDRGVGDKRLTTCR